MRHCERWAEQGRTNSPHLLIQTKRRHEGNFVSCSKREAGKSGREPSPNSWNNTSAQLFRLHRANIHWYGSRIGHAIARRRVFKQPSSIRFLPVNEAIEIMSCNYMIYLFWWWWWWNIMDNKWCCALFLTNKSNDTTIREGRRCRRSLCLCSLCCVNGWIVRHLSSVV